MNKTLLTAGLLAGLALAHNAIADVDASGKEDVGLADVPADVMAVATAAGPGVTFNEAEFETRNGKAYWDIEGEGPNGEIEFDITQVDGQWAVVETQRDISTTDVPSAVAAALADAATGFVPGRIIESIQADGLVIYEFFGADDNDVKHEVSWNGESANWLEDEWEH
ncbi:hypothetical protein F3N42_10205 [Marinihelvus fidelis]|uniref:PepSY domain-containing protein n=1 Tax=Marinihelvus fidelis TaxID=2613842 RepID=A0A5N0T9H3_9GAMM|nr:hypothetical protein [Marinihelvus fidelis]KAA9131675.1 hypothetical protein F3N42_10205 [Marinihelvus fidelis]